MSFVFKTVETFSFPSSGGLLEEESTDAVAPAATATTTTTTKTITQSAPSSLFSSRERRTLEDFGFDVKKHAKVDRYCN